MEHLGLKVARYLPQPHHTHFLSDGCGGIIEVYDNPRGESPDYGQMNPLTLHLAFTSDDPKADADRLADAPKRWNKAAAPDLLV